MTIKRQHQVFSVASNGGLLRVLSTPVTLIDPVTGKELQLQNAIWDTGATSCAINHRVAQALGLTPTGQVKVHTASGVNIANTYLINLRLKNDTTITEIIASDGDLGPHADMLIGMDVISIGDFVVENCGGNTRFAFCLPPFENKYDMIEKANTVNLRIAKANAKLNPPPLEK